MFCNNRWSQIIFKGAHSTGLCLVWCLFGQTEPCKCWKKSQWVRHGKFPWLCDLTYSAITAAISKLKSDREQLIIPWSYCVSFSSFLFAKGSPILSMLYAFISNIITVIVLVIQSVVIRIVLQSSKSLEHKQETCIISSPVHYITLLVVHLMTYWKEDNNVDECFPHCFT